ncbi:unnamed protein product [Orchesella dallaii]|uniref:L-Fucosyltransferase n=1 Tax=Orchesella dallaii TaxID=48710 RepID=A0ABP1S6J4_9HEXA
MVKQFVRPRFPKTTLIISSCITTLFIITNVQVYYSPLEEKTTLFRIRSGINNYEEQDILGKTKLVRTLYNQTIFPPGVILKPRSGTGNQLFHYACSFALARKQNLTLYIDHYQPTSSKSSRKFASAQREFALDQFKIPLNNFISLEKRGKHSKTKLSSGSKIQLISDKDLLQGTFNQANKTNLFYQQAGQCQSELYWKGYEQEIQEMFRLDLESAVNLSKIQNLLNLIQETESVAVHVRRGDFLKAGGGVFAHPISYQKSAIWQMANILRKRGDAKKQLFFVFSDDINYTKKKFKDLAKNHEFIYVSGTKVNGSLITSIEEFYLMTMCKHIIFPISTFSWWAAYLNTNTKKVVISAAFDNHVWNRRRKRKDAKFERELHLTGFHLKEWIVLNPFTGNFPMGNLNTSLYE